MSASQILRNNLNSWIGQTATQVSNGVSSSQPSGHRKPGKIQKALNSHERMILRVKSKVSKGDVRGAIGLLSSADSIAPFSEQTKAALEAKHPPAGPQQPLPPNPNVPTPVFDVKDVKNAIASFKPDSAAGPDGLRPDHLKDLTSKMTGDAGSQLLQSLAILCNKILAGNVTPEICPIFFGASLIALNKEKGGIRPIAVGCTLRRLAAKIVVGKIKNQIGNYLRPHQAGFGTRNGTEFVVHSARRFIDSGLENGVFLKLDFANAFNTVLRPAILKTVAIELPELFPFIVQAYGTKSHLFYGDTLIQSAEGLQQGDPLAPALFSMVIHPLVTRLQSKFNAWFLDDGTLGGAGPDVVLDLEAILEAASDTGLSLNPSKCEVFVIGHPPEEILSAISSLLPGITVLGRGELKLLGAPLSIEALPVSLQGKLDEVRLLISRLPGLPAHMSLYLLKNCLLIPKLVHLLRCSPTWKAPEILKSFDTAFQSALESLLNIQLEETAWLQASLPVSRGGLGIRRTQDLCYSAFLASVKGSSDLISALVPGLTESDPLRSEAFASWSTLCGSADEPTSPLQKFWDAPVLERKSEALLQSATTLQDEARVRAVMCKEAGAWLTAYPSPFLGTLLDDDTVRIASSLRLGTPMCHPHECRCGAEVDERASHGLSCKRSAGRFSRHSAINDVIKRALGSAHIPAVLEPSGTFRDDGKRPDGLTLIPWYRGKCLLWDATCVDTLAASYLQTTSRQAGAAAKAAETKKHQKYRAVADQYQFCPFAVETLGPFGEDARTLTEDLGRRLRQATGEPRSRYFLVQRISIAIQRGNAASILGTLPSSANLHEIFNL
jgi:hypothetical protein